ncbi:MAG TPA: sortase [Anaerolineae bacterium]
MKERSSPNGVASLLMLFGFVLLVAGGISAYPSLRDVLGAEATPRGFGDETSLGASIVQVDESLPPRPQDATAPDETAESTPLVLPETPLESDAPSAPEADPTELPDPPTPSPEPTAQPLATVTGEFVPGVPGRIVIPAINLDAPVEMVSWRATNQNGQVVSMWDVPDRFAAGWLKTSARAGEPGNTVLDGHHNIAGEVFRYLVDLKRGDTIWLWVGDQAREYVVVLLKILPEKGQPISVRLENAKWIMPTKDERVTLVTCWPYTNNTHRLIVVALPADRLPPPDSGAR